MRTSEEVEAEVEASRSDLDRNVEALKQKMTPGQLFDEAARMMGGTGQHVASKFAEQAKANPMPLAVMGLGIAWLMMSNNRSEPRSFTEPYDPQAGYDLDDAHAGGLAEGVKDRARRVGEQAQHMVTGVQEKVAKARESLTESGRSAGHKLSAGVDTARRGADQVGHKAQRTFLDTLHSEPLLIAGAGLLVGLAVGATLPATEAEDRVLGESRDKLVEKGKGLAQEGIEKASSVAQATYGAAKAELQQGDTDREPAELMADAARSGVQAAQNQLRNPQ